MKKTLKKINYHLSFWVSDEGGLVGVSIKISGLEEALLKEEWLTPLPKILFPFTGRRNELNAALVAFRIVEKMGGEVTGFHVVKNGKISNEFVELILGLAKEFKVPFNIVYREGRTSVVEELIRELKRGYDLCICSTGSGIRVWGNVARKLVKKGKTKMLFVHTPRGGGVLPNLLNRILVVHMKESEDINAYNLAVVLSKSWLLAKGELVAVYPVRVPPSVPIDLTYIAEVIEKEEKSFLGDISSKIKNTGSTIIPVTLYARDEAKGLITYANEVKADLIVVGVSRKKYPSRLMHLIPISYAHFLDTLLKHSSCPVLLAFS